MMTTYDDIPTPPARLYSDRRVLRCRIEDCAPWEGRRTSKMRERYYVPNLPASRGASLIAPVQPSVPATYGTPGGYPL